MHQLSSDEVARLKQIWEELGASYPTAGPPDTDEEVAAVALDAWIAGVVSSNGTFTGAGVRDLRELSEWQGEEWQVKGLITRTLSLVSRSL